MAMLSWVLILLGLISIRANSFSTQLLCLIWKVRLECLETVSCQWKHFTPSQVSFKCQQLNIFLMDNRPISEWNILYFHLCPNQNLVSERNMIKKHACCWRSRLNLVKVFACNTVLTIINPAPCWALISMGLLICVILRASCSEFRLGSDFTPSVANDWPAYSPNRMSDALTLPTLRGDPASKFLTVRFPKSRNLSPTTFHPWEMGWIWGCIPYHRIILLGCIFGRRRDIRVSRSSKESYNGDWSWSVDNDMTGEAQYTECNAYSWIKKLPKGNVESAVEKGPAYRSGVGHGGSGSFCAGQLS